MNWLAEINNEFKDVLKRGYRNGKAKLTEEQIDKVELSFIPYTNSINRKRVLISPPVDVIANISDDLYKEIKRIYPKYQQNIVRYFGLNGEQQAEC
jgi:hypothetical protein